jgi:hypothetical protein
LTMSARNRKGIHMGSKGKPTGTVNSPSDDDILACLEHIELELGYPVRQIVNTRKDLNGKTYLVTTLQLLWVDRKTVWVLAERVFEWRSNHDRKYQSRLVIELHKCLHEWGQATHVGLSGR